MTPQMFVLGDLVELAIDQETGRGECRFTHILQNVQEYLHAHAQVRTACMLACRGDGRYLSREHIEAARPVLRRDRCL